MHSGDRVVWIYFRYEGVFKFCKECGCVCHNTGRCPLSAYEAQRIILRRVQEFEDNSMLILQTHEDIPLYTNMIRGLVDRFIYRNPRVNLLHIRPHMNPPSQDPYLFPHLYVPKQTNSDSSFDEFYDTSPELPSQQNPNSYHYISGEHVQNYSNHPPELADYRANYQNYGPNRHPISQSPGRHFRLSSDSCVSFTPQERLHNTKLDLNFPPRNSSPDLNQPNPNNILPGLIPTAQTTPPPYTQKTRFELLERLRLSNWAQGSLRIINNLCVPIGPLNRERS